MYCKGCGKEVADDSKYCQHCGIKLVNNADATNKCSLLLSALAKVKLSNKAKTTLSYYMIWFVINMMCCKLPILGYPLLDGRQSAPV